MKNLRPNNLNFFLTITQVKIVLLTIAKYKSSRTKNRLTQNELN